MEIKSNPSIEELKIIYSEIIDGYSYLEEINLYLKHPTQLDEIKISKFRKILYNNYLDYGIPTEKDRLNQVVKSEEWSLENEEKIKFLRLLISDNEKNLTIVIPQQQEPIKKIIESKKEELVNLLLKRKVIFGNTIESFCEKDLNNYITYNLLYKDESISNKLYDNWEKFDELEEEILAQYDNSLSNKLATFSEENIKKIASLPFFLNPFSQAKSDISLFIDIPIIKMTNYQLLLFQFGNRNTNILSQTEGVPPDILSDNDIESSVRFYDSEYSVLSSKRKN